MRPRLAGLALAVALGGLSLRGAAAEEFPYRAYISTDEVNIRSGPGENYYPVLKLARGDAVEVYRHDPGGWYAIRPPEGSCSWVSGEFVALESEGVGVITGDRVVARVGSAFSDIRDVIQVRLDRDERVEVLEARRFSPDGTAPQTWYKIAPPAGEFRWVAGKYVSRDPQGHAERQRGPSNNLLLARLSASRGAAPRDEASDRIGPHAAPPPHRRSDAHRSDIRSQLEDLDLELSAIVAEEPAAWDFRALSASVEDLLAKADAAADRGHARLLLAKIDRFEDIRRRHDAVMRPGALTQRRPRELPLRSADRPRAAIPDNPRYDGTGKLAQVVSAKVGGPQYALLDANGEVCCYVTGAPGVNLRNYLGREVGIHGTLGYLAELQAQHLTAKRVVTVEDTATVLR